ncbi:uncharacterized protein LOC143529406 [Bidens hawaiensis]|uniref:uncharacterized protein LOC143529406 n=1 Tax=Bidens hawaiensis TaxID=980011 RepID=UPI00404A03AB
MDFSSDDESSSVVPLFIYTVVSTAAAIVTDEGENSTLKTRRVALNRDREAGHERLVADYFGDNPVYDEKMFKRRFRLSKELFIKIAKDLEAYHPFFRQSMDTRGRRGFTTYQKCTAALRQMGYGTTSDAWDEYLRMSERTARERMLGSLDCMHWEWFNCPTSWRGQYMRGDHRHPTVALEAVASQDLWIWHAYFGVAGSNNDLNVLEQTPLFNDIESGVAPDSSFEIDGVKYKYGYYLVDGIYHDYAVFIYSYSAPIGEKRKVFAKAQETARKDIERAFGVLKKMAHYS